MWVPPSPDPPPPGWWHDLETAEQWETRQWIADLASDLRAERIERLRALAHEVDMRAAGACASDRWERIQRRRDLQGAVRHPGGLLLSQTGNREVFHSHHWGPVVSVR